ncbi:MAG: hypothetical protein OHK0015_07000 [Chloroflexi bacterium OHK40]
MGGLELAASGSAGRCGFGDDRLLEELLGAPAWATPARLAPVADAGRGMGQAAVWPAGRYLRRPAAFAAVALLAGGVIAASVGPAPAIASRGDTSPARRLVVAVAPAAGALARLTLAPAAPTAHTALLARLLAAPPADEQALLAALLAEPAFELAPGDPPVASGVAAPAVSFATSSQLPDAAFVYRAATVALPAITLDQQRYPPPPPPPPTREIAQAQPPAPPGYVQPPGYQDGVPFGGQPGAVPSAGRPAGGVSRPASPTRPAATAYIVRVGDTLTAIAFRYYGSARYAPAIWEANYAVIGANPNRIYPGQRLVLPSVTPRPSAPTALPARGPIAQRSYYTIQPQDYLRWMAQRAYGTEVFWPEIYHANRNVLGPNPDLIFPGVRVYIP